MTRAGSRGRASTGTAAHSSPSTEAAARLRAQAALWSLRAALALLADRIAEEDRAIRAARAAAADPLRSPMWGRRHALGGYGDPTSEAIEALGSVAARPNRWASLEREVLEQLASVAQHLPGQRCDGCPRQHACTALGCARVTRMTILSSDNLLVFEVAIPGMSAAAADATRVLCDRLDTRIRRLLGVPFDQHLVPRTPCPDCDTVSLIMRTSPPPAQRVVECTSCGAAWTRSEMVHA